MLKHQVGSYKFEISHYKDVLPNVESTNHILWNDHLTDQSISELPYQFKPKNTEGDQYSKRKLLLDVLSKSYNSLNIFCNDDDMFAHVPETKTNIDIIKNILTLEDDFTMTNNDRQDGGNEKEVRVYSGRSNNTDRSIYKKFYEETGIKVRLIEAAGISLIERLKREGNNAQADLILLVDAARITKAAKAGLLQRIESSSLENDVPEGLKDPNKEWYALTRRVRVMVANRNVVDINQIKDYSDLADPSLKGKVCLRNGKSSYNQSLVANQIVNKGEEATNNWLKGMISNVSQPFFTGDIALIRAVAKSECGIGIVDHYKVARMLAGVNGRRNALYAKKVQVLTPNPAHVNISAGSVTKYSRNKTEAIILLEYLASPRGSKSLATPAFEHPLKEVNQNPIIKNFGDFTPDDVTVKDLAVNNSLAIKLMKDAGWD